MLSTTVNGPVVPQINEILAAHVRGYRSASDETYERDPICAECEHSWPCDTARLGALVGAEVAHRVNPVIGWLRLAERDGRPASAASHKRLAETVAFFGEAS